MKPTIKIESDNSLYPATTKEASRGWVFDGDKLLGSYAIIVRTIGCTDNTPEENAVLDNAAACAASVSEALMLASVKEKTK